MDKESMTFEESALTISKEFTFLELKTYYNAEGSKLTTDEEIVILRALDIHREIIKNKLDGEK